MPYRDTESKRFAGRVRWRRGDVFDADDREGALAAGALEVTREEAADTVVDEPIAPKPARPKAVPLAPEPPADV